MADGPGFAGHELLSRDELATILDYEDEQNRLGQFTCIYPTPGNVCKYYGFMEFKRYKNALYCAWLSTPLDIRKQIIENC